MAMDIDDSIKTARNHETYHLATTDIKTARNHETYI